MKIFGDLVKKYGFGTILAIATLDGYRRSLQNDISKEAVDAYNKKNLELTDKDKNLSLGELELEIKKAKLEVKVDNLKQAANEYEKQGEAYDKNPGNYNKDMLKQSRQKLDEAVDNVKNSSFFEYFNTIYENYLNYLSSLTPDKIVAMFNIIMNGLIFSSFFTILSILLSEQMINRFSFLEKYPKILKLLRVRNYVNKKINKFYLVMHLILIIFGILGNIYILII
jgi:small-conductance mechanosensitive channel